MLLMGGRTAEKSRITDLGAPSMLRNAQMTAVRTLRRGLGANVEWPLWADHVEQAVAFARGGKRKFAGTAPRISE